VGSEEWVYKSQVNKLELRSGGGNCKVAPWQPTNWPVSTEVGWGSSSVSGWLAGWMPDRRTHRPIEPENRRAVEPKNQSGDVRRILEFESLPTGSRWSCSRSRRWLRRDRQTSRHESKDPKVKCINWYSYRQDNSTREHDYIFCIPFLKQFLEYILTIWYTQSENPWNYIYFWN